MIADYDTMPMMFSECNRLYFNHSLPTPKFGLINTLNTIAKFSYNKNVKKGSKTPIKWQEILFSDCYDFDEETFRNIMVHEMIHYYIAINGIKDNKKHGKVFMKMANEINEKYGLNITKRGDTTSYKETNKAPKRRGLWSCLFGL